MPVDKGQGEILTYFYNILVNFMVTIYAEIKPFIIGVILPSYHAFLSAVTQRQGKDTEL